VGGGGSARRSTGFARLCAQVSCLLRDWMVWVGGNFLLIG
jgi:hypothetical protein